MDLNEKKDYDDDNEHPGRMPMSTMWAQVDQADAGATEGLPELQTDSMGHPEPLDAKGYVYFIETEDSRFIKIGFSRKPMNRLGKLGTLMPLRLLGYFPASRSTEAWLHQKFILERTTGEWFNNCSPIQSFIQVMGLMQPEPPKPPKPPKPKLPKPVKIGPAEKPLLEPSIEDLGPESVIDKNPHAVALRKLAGSKPGLARAANLSAAELSRIGKKGGKVGGKARAERLTPEQRSEIARKAGLAGGRGREKRNVE